jgi:hypothetical protein
MRTTTTQPAALLAVLAASLLAPARSAAQIPSFGGEAFSTEGANCYALKLKAATGVVGLKHTYHFVGSCWDGNRSFPAEAYVSWDRPSYTLVEDFRIIGTYVNADGWSYSGRVLSQLKCNDDPEVIPTAVCNPVSHVNETKAHFLSTPYLKQRRPITKGRTTLAEAKAYSQLAAVAQGAANVYRLDR